MAQQIEQNELFNIHDCLDYEEHECINDIDAEEISDEDIDSMIIYWNIDQSLFADFKSNKLCQSSEIEIDGYPDYKWIVSLQSNNDEDAVECTLSPILLPKQIGALKCNVTISCNNVSYVKEYKDIVLTIADELRVNMKGKYPIHIKDTIDVRVFENAESLRFKCRIEPLIWYGLFGGIYSEQDQPIYVAKSDVNHKLVFGFLNEIHNFELNKIQTSPVSIYDLVYKHYLMIINVRHSYRGDFRWEFDNKKAINMYLHCQLGDVLTSRKFEVNGHEFYLELTPNGWGKLVPLGSGIVWLAVHKFPDNVKQALILFQVVCDEVGYSEARAQVLSEPAKGVHSMGPM